jgi:glycerol-3-phosphate dehydrogenase
VSKHYDVLVIGGGIHGAGATQAAAAAGYSVLALEKTALAAATSSRSSKLIHGGLRYLESGHLGMVRESLHERAVLLRIAPELVRLAPFFIPIYPQTRRRPWQIAAGLSLYALLGGMKRENLFARLPRSAWNNLDGIDTRQLQHVFRYYDGQTDDATLTRAVMRSALSLGAELVLPGTFVAARREDSLWSVDYLDGTAPCSCTASAIVNAGGGWSNEILSKISPRPPTQSIELLQGTHIVIDAPTRSGVYYVEAADGRAVFVMPWQNKTLVGTTETRVSGDPGSVAPQVQEVAYLENLYRKYFPGKARTASESFAGVRVIPTGTNSVFHRSREAVLLPDDARRPHLVTIYGGKLTSYRATTGHAVDMLRHTLPPREQRAQTAALRLSPV